MHAHVVGSIYSSAHTWWGQCTAARAQRREPTKAGPIITTKKQFNKITNPSCEIDPHAGAAVQMELMAQLRDPITSFLCRYALILPPTQCVCSTCVKYNHLSSPNAVASTVPSCGRPSNVTRRTTTTLSGIEIRCHQNEPQTAVRVAPGGLAHNGNGKAFWHGTT
jgi:hypothetical protein